MAGWAGQGGVTAAESLSWTPTLAQSHTRLPILGHFLRAAEPGAACRADFAAENLYGLSQAGFEVFRRRHELRSPDLTKH